MSFTRTCGAIDAGAWAARPFELESVKSLAGKVDRRLSKAVTELQLPGCIQLDCTFWPHLGKLLAEERWKFYDCDDRSTCQEDWQ